MNANNFDAIQTITQGIAALRSTGATSFLPLYLPFLAMAYTRLNQFDEAWRVIGEAITVIEETGETWCEAEVNRVAGEIALKSPEPNAAKARATSSARSRSRASSKPNPGNSAPQ